MSAYWLGIAGGFIIGIVFGIVIFATVLIFLKENRY